MIISPCDEILTTAASIVSYNQPADRYLLSIDISTRWHFTLQPWGWVVSVGEPQEILPGTGVKPLHISSYYPSIYLSIIIIFIIIICLPTV